MIAGLVAAGIAVAAATWLARRLARPIRAFAVRTATIAKGDFTPMPPVRYNDELSDLAESINHMTGQLAKHQRQALHNERLRTLAQLGASMAHQLRNAATGGRMAIELHRRDCPSGHSDESLDVALRQMRLMESYLRQFLSIDKPAAAIRERVDTTLLVAEVLELVRPSCLHAGIDLQFCPPSDPLFIKGEPEALRQLVTNLVVNATEAAVAGKAAPPRSLGRDRPRCRWLRDPERAGYRPRAGRIGLRSVVRVLCHYQAGWFWNWPVRGPANRRSPRRPVTVAARRGDDVFFL